MQLNGAAPWCLCVRFRAGQLRSGQDVRHLADNRADLGQIIGELHAADDGRDKPHGEDHNENEFLRCQRSVFQQQTADGEHAQKRRRHDVHGKGKVEVALVHPVDVAFGAFLCCGYKFLIAAFRLAEHLNDLDAADVLHCRVVERVGGGYSAGVILVVARHHQHKEHHTKRECDERGQRHAPVDDKQINQCCHGDCGVAAHLRDSVRQRRFNAVHALDKNIFQFAGAAALHIAQRHFCQFRKSLCSDIAQHGEGRLVGLRRGQRMEQYPQKPERRHDSAVDQIACEVFVPRKQLLDDLRHHKKRQDLKRRTDDGEDHACEIARFFLPGEGKDPAEGTFFFFHISHLTSKIFFTVGSSSVFRRCPSAALLYKYGIQIRNRG